MRVPASSTKMVVHSSAAPQGDNPQQRQRCKQTFSTPQQKSPCSQWRFTEIPPTSAFNKKFNNKEQTLTGKSDHSDSQLEDTKTKPTLMPLNIQVTDEDEPTEVNIRNGECKELEDSMANLSVSGKESKTEQTVSEEDLKVSKKENDSHENTESLNDSFQKLAISAGANKKPSQKHEKDHKEEGELIERGPVSSSKKVQPLVAHPYRQQTSALTTQSTRYSFQSGGILVEASSVYESHMSEIPQSVEELSSRSAVNFTKETEEIITSEILNEENFKSFVKDWLSKEIEQGDDTSITNVQPPGISEPFLGNTSPHCSRDSAYSTLSPDSSVVSPLSYMSPMPSPVYNGNDFTHETFLNEIVTRNSTTSESNHLPNEPIESLDLFDLIDDYLNTTKCGNEVQQNNCCVRPDKHEVRNRTQQSCQFYVEPSKANSMAPQVPHVTSDNATQELSHNNAVTPPVLQVVNHKLLSQTPPNILQPVHADSRLSTNHPLTIAYNVTGNRFNFTVSSAAPQKYVLANLTPVNNVQTNLINHQTVYIPAKPNSNVPVNIPVVSAVSPFTQRRNFLPVAEASHPDNSVNSFICGDSGKKSISKSVPSKFAAATNSVRPVERQILPAGSEVYETGMSVPAAVRLKSLMKNMDFTVQYVKVCHELANRPVLLKERLFQLLCESPRAQNWLIRIYAHIALTVSMESKASVLTARNSEGRSLLYLACINHPDQPVIARYIADSLFDISRTSKTEVTPDEIYDGHGNSLVHLLASLGDSHVFVLAELLNIVHPKTKEPAFNVNRPNSQKETPLHMAVSKHSLPYINCLSTVKVIITHGANVTAQDNRGMTPLHYAVQGNCEPKILTLLLQSRTSHAALDIMDYEHNSAIHLAAANNGISLLKQRAIISSLIGHGADYRLPNMDGKVPLMLVDIERRQEIKKLLPKK